MSTALTFEEYNSYDGLGLAHLVKSGQLSAFELLECAIAAADRLNPALNAIIHRFDERAKSAARKPLPDGLFHGVPFLLKDLLDDLAGEPTTGGRAGQPFLPDKNSPFVRRLLAAGLNPFGKTNLAELGMAVTTEPLAFGPTHNPWRENYSSGGSSGGSAAAVAAGIVPLASGNDAGGSLRFPAACCGVFGLKPSHGLNPTNYAQGGGVSGALSSHVVSRSIRDSAAVLDCTAGFDRASIYRVERSVKPYQQATNVDPPPLKIAVCRQPLIPGLVHEESLRGLDNTVGLLEKLGHHVIEHSPIPQSAEIGISFLKVLSANAAADISYLRQEFGKQSIQLLEPGPRFCAMLGRAMTGEEYQLAMRHWYQLTEDMGVFFKNYDMLLTPTLVCPPSKHGELLPSRVDKFLISLIRNLPSVGRLMIKTQLIEQVATPMLEKMGFTILANMTGLPSMSVPLHWTEDGLPLGMLFTGKMCDEHTLFQLAGQLERIAPWKDKTPTPF